MFKTNINNKYNYSNKPMPPLSEKQIKRNIIKFMGFNLPNKILDEITAEDIRIFNDKFQVRLRCKINMKDWKLVMGSSK